jgi:murein DD-endopeptidase MepM/ murein hydrolase activator NlpD
MGLYSMYGHCTELLVKVGETVHAGGKIALTGKTGVASGDHLHFGMLIHGVYVNSEEWMNPYWIKTNVTMVLDKAKKSMKK